MILEDKIDVLFYLFGICMVLWIVRTSISIKKLLSPKILDQCRARLAEWDSKANYEEMLSNLDRYIIMYPGEVEFLWSKGVALYKLEKFKEARDTFVDLSENEPDYKVSASRYILSIDEKERA